MLAPLDEGVGEDVQLGQHGVESQPQDAEPPVRLGDGAHPTGPGPQPGEVTLDKFAERPAALGEIPLDAGLGGRRNGGGQHRGHLEGEGLHTIKAG